MACYGAKSTMPNREITSGSKGDELIDLPINGSWRALLSALPQVSKRDGKPALTVFPAGVDGHSARADPDHRPAGVRHVSGVNATGRWNRINFLFGVFHDLRSHLHDQELRRRQNIQACVKLLGHTT